MQISRRRYCKTKFLQYLTGNYGNNLVIKYCSKFTFIVGDPLRPLYMTDCPSIVPCSVNVPLSVGLSDDFPARIIVKNVHALTNAITLSWIDQVQKYQYSEVQMFS